MIAVQIRLAIEIDVKGAHGGVGLRAYIGNGHIEIAGFVEKFICGFQKGKHLGKTGFCLWNVNALYLISQYVGHRWPPEKSFLL